MGIDRGNNFLSLCLPWRLEIGVANAGGNGEVRLEAPRILHIPLNLIGAEMTVKEVAIRQGAAGGGAVEIVVVVVSDRRNAPDEVGEGDVVRVCETVVSR